MSESNSKLAHVYTFQNCLEFLANFHGRGGFNAQVPETNISDNNEMLYIDLVQP